MYPKVLDCVLIICVAFMGLYFLSKREKAKE